MTAGAAFDFVGRKAGFRCFCFQNFDWFRKQTLGEWPERKKADRPVGRAIDFHRSLGPLSASGEQDWGIAFGTDCAVIRACV